MKRNQLLFWAGIVSKLAEIIFYLVLVISIIFLIHWNLDKEYYKGVEVVLNDGSIMLLEGRSMTDLINSNVKNINGSLKNGNLTAPEKNFYITDLNALSFYLTYIQLVLSSILSILIIKEIRKVLKSVKEFETFRNSNIKSFQRLGYYCLAFAALNCVRILATNERRSISFNPGITILSFMISAFILAEIFKEGKRLAEIDQLTI
jgi:hypothetical protein